MKHWRISKWVLGVAVLLDSACHSAPGEATTSFFDKLNGVNGVSESLAQSRQLHLLLRPLRCTPARLVLGDSVNLDIREAYLEQGWQCGPGCASVRALNNSDRNVQIVLKCTPRSNAGNLNIYWFLDLGDRILRNGQRGLGVATPMPRCGVPFDLSPLHPRQGPQEAHHRFVRAALALVSIIDRSQSEVVG